MPDAAIGNDNRRPVRRSARWPRTCTNCPARLSSAGQEIGHVAVLDRLVIKGDIDQTDFQLLRDMHRHKTEVRLAGLLGKTIPGGAIDPAARGRESVGRSVPRLARRRRRAGRSRDPNGMRTQQPTFEARVKLDNQYRTVLRGSTRYVRSRWTADRSPGSGRIAFLQLIQSHDSGMV